MTSITRWDPLAELESFRNEMEKLFREAFGRRKLLPEPSYEAIWSPAIDMFETENEVVVKAMLPGLKKEDLELSFTDDTLTIKGESKLTEETKKKNYYRREIACGQFLRTIAIPVPIKEDQIEAEFKDGILEVRLPKSEEAKPKVRKVEVK